jgi:hypothetical protein
MVNEGLCGSEAMGVGEGSGRVKKGLGALAVEFFFTLRRKADSKSTICSWTSRVWLTTRDLPVAK